MMSDRAAPPPTSSDRVELIVSRPGHPDRRLMLKAGVISLGRGEDNDLVLPDIGVSRRHARIIVDHAGVTVEDLGSGNGTLYEGRPVRKKQIEDGDVLQIDPFQLRFLLHLDGRMPLERLDAPAGPPRLVLTSDTELDRNIYPILPTGLTLGRATDQDVVLNDPASSRRHIVITPRQGGIWLEDVGSANGTFVNDERVFQQHMLQNGDEVRVGQTTFRFEVGGGSAADPLSGMWADSGVWQRPMRDDSPRPEPRFSDRQAPETATMPPTHRATSTATSSSSSAATTRQIPASSPPREGSGQGRILLLVGVLLLFLVVMVIVAIAVGPRLLASSGLLEAAATPALERAPPDTTLPVQVTAADAGQKLVLGRALLAAARPLDAATLLFQARKADPSAVEIERLGYVACEAAAMQALRDALRRPGISGDSRTLQNLTRTAERADDAALPALRSQLSDALLVAPDDARLVAALGKVDSRLAGLAGETLAEAEAAADTAAAWPLLTEALTLAPTSTAAARVAWGHLRAAQDIAAPLARQALALDVGGQPAEAARLYTRVTTVLPGEDEPLERLARARLDALAP